MDTTTISKRWLWKMIFMLGLLIFFGFYGLYDALHAYPKRGLKHAEHSEWKYLEALSEDNALIHPRASASDPAARLKELDAKPTRTRTEEAQWVWLTSLSRVGALSQARLVDSSGQSIDVQTRFRTLKDQWTGTQTSPVPLAAFDIPTQWLFVLIGFGGGGWMLSKLLPVLRKTYSWDAPTKTLTLPDGAKLNPSDIEDFDKRQWKKFFIYLKIKPGHPTLGGKELKLDLYTHDKLESWVLDMERTAFPERAIDSAGQPGASPDGHSSGGTATTSGANP
jgi:hypothetical protein